MTLVKGYLEFVFAVGLGCLRTRITPIKLLDGMIGVMLGQQGYSLTCMLFWD